MRDKIEKAEGILMNVYATIEKIEPGEKNLTHGLMLRHDLSRLKLLRADLRREKAKTPWSIEKIDHLVKTGYETSCETFRALIKKKDQVKHFFTNLECLAYFCYFSISIENISQTFQFAAIIKGLVEAFIKKISSDDKNNLLVEVMIFCKKYQISKEQRFELYHLLVVTLVLYSSSLYQTEQRQKSLMFLDKVLNLLQTIEPEGGLIPIITNMKLLYQSQSEKKSLLLSNEDYQIKVTVEGEEEGQSKQAQNSDELEINQDGKPDHKASKSRKKLFSQNKAKLSALTNGLFIPGFRDGKISEETLKKFSDTWAVKQKKEKEVSMKQTLKRAYDDLVPSIPEVDDANQNKQSAGKADIQPINQELSQTSLKLELEKKNLESKSSLKPYHSPEISKRRSSFAKIDNKAYVRPSTATFGKGKSVLSQSLAQSRRNSIDNSKGSRQGTSPPNMGKSSATIFKSEKKGSMVFVDQKRELTHGLEFTEEDKDGKKKPKSVAKQLQNLLYKADLREQMPDKYIFNNHKAPKIVGVKQSKWIHERQPTKTSDASTGFSISKDWFYDRMMADRLKEDPDRVLTNNTTINIKNHQVMIEFKTGVHEGLPPPKNRIRNSNNQKEYLIKCSLTGNYKEVFLKKGMPFGYLDHQIDERKKAFDDSIDMDRKVKTVMPSANHSKSHSMLPQRKPSEDATQKSHSRLTGSKKQLHTVMSQGGSFHVKSQVGQGTMIGGVKGQKLSEEEVEKLGPGHSKDENLPDGRLLSPSQQRVGQPKPREGRSQVPHRTSRRGAFPKHQEKDAARSHEGHRTQEEL